MTVRVTAGTAKGRILFIPKTHLRPTSDKVKQAMFSMLEAEALRRGFTGDEDTFASTEAWPHGLDLFAGSGALGIELLSRGAVSVVFVESDRDAIKTIERNLERTNLQERAHLRQGSVTTVIASLPGAYDCILLDPPYQDHLLAMQTLELIAQRGLLAERGVVVWEHDREAVALGLPNALRCLRQRDYGGTSVSILERNVDEQQGEHD